VAAVTLANLNGEFAPILTRIAELKNRQHNGSPDERSNIREIIIVSRIPSIGRVFARPVQ
jgi:hypothetical protein